MPNPSYQGETQILIFGRPVYKVIILSWKKYFGNFLPTFYHTIISIFVLIVFIFTCNLPVFVGGDSYHETCQKQQNYEHFLKISDKSDK